MARHVPEEITWKPRRLRKQDIDARVAHLQKTLPSVVREVFAEGEKRAEAPAAKPAKTQKKSKFAVLHWEQRPPDKKR